MQDLSVLTPPLLMCAVVIFAVVVFLRHEMRRGRADDGDRPDDSGAQAQVSGKEDDVEAGGGAGSAPSMPADR